MLRAAAALWALLVVPTLPLASTAPWSWPVDPPRAVVRPYIAPLTPYSSGHRGVDIRAPAGTAFAPAAGVVHFAGVVVDRPVLSIRHANGVISSYEPLESTLTIGDAVARGDPIGTVLPGHCVTVCLHVGVRVDGQYLSPMGYFGEIPRAVLLPTRWELARVDANATVDYPPVCSVPSHDYARGCATR
jgi:murein DD-endopeptidase MepM/ murein hydrolase activator NlpD